MRLYEYRVIKNAEYDNEGNETSPPKTLVSGEDHYENPTEAREELIMANAEVITKAGGIKAVEVLVRPFRAS